MLSEENYEMAVREIQSWPEWKRKAYDRLFGSPEKKTVIRVEEKAVFERTYVIEGEIDGISAATLRSKIESLSQPDGICDVLRDQGFTVCSQSGDGHYKTSILDVMDICEED